MLTISNNHNTACARVLQQRLKDFILILSIQGLAYKINGLTCKKTMHGIFRAKTTLSFPRDFLKPVQAMKLTTLRNSQAKYIYQ